MISRVLIDLIPRPRTILTRDNVDFRCFGARNEEYQILSFPVDCGSLLVKNDIKHVVRTRRGVYIKFYFCLYYEYNMVII